MALQHDQIDGLYKEKDAWQKAYDKGYVTAEELTAASLRIKNEIRKQLSLEPAE